MKYVLIKHKDVKLLVNEGLHMQPLLCHLHEIEILAEKVNELHRNLLNATKEKAQQLEHEARELTSKIGYKIIGVPFTNHDAELYAINKQLDFETLELK